MDTDVNGLEVISRAEAVALLRTQDVGRLVYTRRALPAITPVTYLVSGDAVLIWTSALSSLVPAVREAVVGFEVDEVDPVARTGWSVAVTGTASLVHDPVKLALARQDGPDPWAPQTKEHLIRIPLTVVTGRRFGAYRAAELV